MRCVGGCVCGCRCEVCVFGVGEGLFTALFNRCL